MSPKPFVTISTDRSSENAFSTSFIASMSAAWVLKNPPRSLFSAAFSKRYSLRVSPPSRDLA